MTTIQAPDPAASSPMPSNVLYRVTVCRGASHRPGCECELFHHDFADGRDALAARDRWLSAAAVLAGTEHVDLTVVSPTPAALSDEKLREFGVGSI